MPLFLRSLGMASIGVVVLISCQSALVIHFENHQPYCGGKKPTEEESLGQTQICANKTYYLVKDQNVKQKMKAITSKQDGNWNGRVSFKNRIDLYDADKFLSLESLMAKYPLLDPENYRYFNEKELSNWRQAKDGTILKNSLNKTEKMVNITKEKGCFVGDNPIIIYIGPKPRR